MTAPVRDQEWRNQAACASSAPWFDDVIDGETVEARTARLAAAMQVCRRCPVTEACHAERRPEDGGVWAGRVFSAARTINRGRPARLSEEEKAAREAARRPCPVCGIPYRADNLRKHQLRHQGMAS